MQKVEVNKLHTLGGHNDCVYTLEKGPKSHQFFSSGGDGMVALWDLDDPENGRMIARVGSSVYALHYYAERNVLVIGKNFEGIHLIDMESRKEVGSIKLSQAAIFDIKVIKDRIFLAFGDGKVMILDITTLDIIHEFRATEESARCIAINEISAEFSVGYSDNKIRVYSLIDWQLKHELEVHKNSVFTVQYSPDSRYLISGSRDAHLKIWDAKNGYLPHESIVAHMYAINHLVYSPDGKHFVTCSMDKSIKVWDAETFRLLKVIDKARHAGHGTSVNKLHWSDYNNLLVSGSDDRSISIWDINF